MKIGSLFDGSGGFPLAGVMRGGIPVWRSEVEPYPIAVTKSRFPNMVHMGDVSKVKGDEVEPVDIITFGSPCQDLSVAGKRAGLKHEENGDEETTRSGLFMEAIRIIKEMRKATNGLYPTFAIWENVPGAFSSNKGEDFRVVLEEFVKISEPSAKVPPIGKGGWPYADTIVGDGWSIAYRVFDVQYWGVPQRRRRIYLVADFRGERAAEILFEREGLRGYFEKGRTPWKSIATYTERDSGADDRARAIGVDIYNFAITGNMGRTLSTPSGGLNEHIPLVIQGVDVYNQALTGDKTARIRASAQDSDHIPCIAYTVDQGGGKSSVAVAENMAPTLNCMHEQQAVVQKKGRYIVRRLTPTECARLQGFPDKWGHPNKKESLTDEEYLFWLDVRNTHARINGKTEKHYSPENMLKWYNKLHTDSSEYKMWGNGIALPNALYVMQGIAKRLAVLDEQGQEGVI